MTKNRTPEWRSMRKAALAARPELQSAANGFLLSPQCRGLSIQTIEQIAPGDLLQKFRELRWPFGAPVCPKCGKFGAPRKALLGVLICTDGACRKEFTDTSETVFCLLPMWKNGLVAHDATRAILLAIATLYGAERGWNPARKAAVFGWHPRKFHRLIEVFRRVRTPNARERFFGGAPLHEATDWLGPDDTVLRSAIERGASLDDVARVLGRRPRTALYRAWRLGLEAPHAWWAQYYAQTSTGIERERRRGVGGVRSTPTFNVNRIVGQHFDSDLLRRVFEGLPAWLPRQARDDIQQSIMLAVLEGQTGLMDLLSDRRSLRAFLTSFYKMNYEQSGFASRLSREDDRRPFAEGAAIIVQEWRKNTFEGRYTPARQEDLVYARQVASYHARALASGRVISLREALVELEGVGLS